MDKKALDSFVGSLLEGVETPLGLLKLRRKTQGRFKEEFNLELNLNSNHLLYMKVFTGRGKFYKEWAEIFGINPLFFGSAVEETLFKEISQLFGRVFVEYFEDRETVEELSKGVPPALSRLGYKLLSQGYTWFRDWYIPEGLMEGGHKLQAQKPDGKSASLRHAEEIKKQLDNWLTKYTERDTLRDRVLRRYKRVSTLGNPGQR